jgi:hypothetical protein
MARYTLIIKDSTYAKLLLMAAERKMTLGKFLNEALDKVAEVYESEKKEGP